MRPDPYRVWLSEIMLQQTTVAAVKPYFDDFRRALADGRGARRGAARRRDEGVGRARLLRAGAQPEGLRRGGRRASMAGGFPETAAGLKALPGIGDYTAAAIAAIAFDEPAAVVDGNIERVIARLFAIDTPLPAAKKIIREHQARADAGNARRRLRAGDDGPRRGDLHAEAAGLLALPARPSRARRGPTGEQEAYPVKAEKAERPTRCGAAFVAVRADGAVLLRQRAGHAACSAA